MKHTKKSKISVIVLTKNRPALLGKNLASLIYQTVKPFEVIVIDGSVNEDSARIVASFRDTLPLRYYRESVGTIAYARQLGANKSIGDIVIYLDDDLQASPHYIQRVFRHFLSYPRSIALMGRVTNGYRTNIIASVQYAFYERWLSCHFVQFLKITKLTHGSALDCEVMAVKKLWLKRIRFDTRVPKNFRNDDAEFGSRLLLANRNIYFDPHLIARASPRTSLVALLATNFWNGYSDELTRITQSVNVRSLPHRQSRVRWYRRQWKESRRFGNLLRRFSYIALLTSYPIASRLGTLYCKVQFFLGGGKP